MREEERKRLLWPSWAVARNGARYEALDEESKAIWRETRGQSVSADTQVTWVDELAMGIQAGLITKDEAREAIKRIGLD